MKLLSKKQNLIFIILLFTFKNPLFCQVGADTAQIIYDLKHYSKYFKEERNYRIFLPPNYYINKVKVYPVIYFFHGFGGRFNGPYGTDPNGNMESRYYDSWTGNAYLCGSDSLDNIKHFVKCHNVIVVKWDGYVNPQNILILFQVLPSLILRLHLPSGIKPLRYILLSRIWELIISGCQ